MMNTCVREGWHRTNIILLSLHCFIFSVLSQFVVATPSRQRPISLSFNAPLLNNIARIPRSLSQHIVKDETSPATIAKDIKSMCEEVSCKITFQTLLLPLHFRTFKHYPYYCVHSSINRHVLHTISPV